MDAGAFLDLCNRAELRREQHNAGPPILLPAMALTRDRQPPPRPLMSIEQAIWVALGAGGALYLLRFTRP